MPISDPLDIPEPFVCGLCRADFHGWHWKLRSCTCPCRSVEPSGACWDWPAGPGNRSDR